MKTMVDAILLAGLPAHPTLNPDDPVPNLPSKWVHYRGILRWTFA
jgi:hypothetical protein